jgi:hypothetical protein
MSIPILVRRPPHAEGLLVPAYASAGAGGMDLPAAVGDPVNVAPGARWTPPAPPPPTPMRRAQVMAALDYPALVA